MLSITYVYQCDVSAGLFNLDKSIKSSVSKYTRPFLQHNT